MDEIRALVIGTAGGEIPGIKIVEAREVQFPTSVDKCGNILVELGAEAKGRGLALLFREVPIQLTAALTAVVSQERESLPGRFGFVITSPGPQPDPVTVEVNCSDGNEFSCGWAVYDLCLATNPQARVEGDGTSVAVTYRPPTPLEIDGIAWC